MCPHHFMKTIICDIDGTLTNLWLMERLVLSCLLGDPQLPVIERLKKSGTSETYKIFKSLSSQKMNKKEYQQKYIQTFKKLEKENFYSDLEKYPLVEWIIRNPYYHFVYVTGGQKVEALYALKNLGIIQ